MSRGRSTALLVTLALSTPTPACLLGPNPDFIEPGDETGETGETESELIFDELADSYTDLDQPEQVFGAEPLLRVDSRRDAYIELPRLGELIDDAELTGITLILSCTRAGAPVEIYELESSWDEDTLTAANAPMIEPELIASFEPVLGSNEIALPVEGSPQAIERYRHGLVLRSEIVLEAGERGPEFASAEAGDGPYLIVTTTPCSPCTP